MTDKIVTAEDHTKSTTVFINEMSASSEEKKAYRFLHRNFILTIFMLFQIYQKN